VVQKAKTAMRKESESNRCVQLLPSNATNPQRRRSKYYLILRLGTCRKKRRPRTQLLPWNHSLLRETIAQHLTLDILQSPFHVPAVYDAPSCAEPWPNTFAQSVPSIVIHISNMSDCPSTRTPQYCRYARLMTRPLRRHFPVEILSISKQPKPTSRQRHPHYFTYIFHGCCLRSQGLPIIWSNAKNWVARAVSCYWEKEIGGLVRSKMIGLSVLRLDTSGSNNDYSTVVGP
jgi:hypothetical protein